MARACVIVLDAVGAGELPDAAEFGDDGVEHPRERRPRGGWARPADAGGTRLRQHRAARGLRAPAGRACGRRSAPGTLEGQGHDDRPLGADGCRHATGDADLPVRVPGRGDRPVHEPDRPRACSGTSRRAARRSSRSSARSISGPASGSSTRAPTRCSRSRRTRRRSRSRSSTTPAGRPREILTGKHAVGRVIARPFVGVPGSYERTPNRHDFSLEPRRPNYLSLARDAGHKVYGVGQDRRHLRSPGHRRGVPDEVERRGHPEDGGTAPNRGRRADLHEPRRDGLALGPPERSGELPSLPAGLRPPAARSPRCAATERPLHPHVRPRLRPDDAVDRPLARARVAARLRRGPQRGGSRARGRRVRRRRRHRQRLARRACSRKGHSGDADRRAG